MQLQQCRSRTGATILYSVVKQTASGCMVVSGLCGGVVWPCGVVSSVAQTFQLPTPAQG